MLSAYPSSCQQVVAPTTADAVNDVPCARHRSGDWGVGPEGAPGLLQGSVVGGSVIGVPSASVYAAPLWGHAMRGVEDLLPDADFVYPAAVPGAGATP